MQKALGRGGFPQDLYLTSPHRSFPEKAGRCGGLFPQERTSMNNRELAAEIAKALQEMWGDLPVFMDAELHTPTEAQVSDLIYDILDREILD